MRSKREREVEEVLLSSFAFYFKAERTRKTVHISLMKSVKRKCVGYIVMMRTQRGVSYLTRKR